MERDVLFGITILALLGTGMFYRALQGIALLLIIARLCWGRYRKRSTVSDTCRAA